MARKCTMCRLKVGEDDIICAHCGAGLPLEEEGLGALAALYWLLDFAPGLASPTALIGSVLAMLGAVPLAYLGLGILVMGAPFSGIMIVGFALMTWATGWAWLLCGYVCLPAEALTEFNSTKWTVWVMAAVAPVVAVAAFLALTHAPNG